MSTFICKDHIMDFLKIPSIINVTNYIKTNTTYERQQKKKMKKKIIIRFARLIEISIKFRILQAFEIFRKYSK